MSEESGYLAYLQGKTKDELVNDLFSIQVSQYADYDPNETDQHGYGKRIPYIGWFWRKVDIVGKQITIGNCGDFIGVMMNNKWGYPERDMTEQEVDMFIAHLERVFACLLGGGDVANIHAKANQACDEMWEWFQTLKVE